MKSSKSILRISLAALTSAFFLSSTSFGWTATSPSTKEYTFKYQMKGKSLELKKVANSYEDAFESAAQQCFNFYKGSEKVSEDKGLDIIDTCANPRS